MKAWVRRKDQVDAIRVAIGHLRLARMLLTHAGAAQSLTKVRRALKSTEGALRNAERFEGVS